LTLRGWGAQSITDTLYQEPSRRHPWQPPPTRPRRARAPAVIAAVLAALAAWLVTDRLLGVDLAAPTRPGSRELQSITPALVAGTSLVVALAGT
jgi:Family of unknown function (DUF6069)